MINVIRVITVVLFVAAIVLALSAVIDSNDNLEDSVEILTDEERGVVCYVYRNRGISCVPLNEGEHR